MTVTEPGAIRLAAVAAGPVFYQVPLYRRLAKDSRLDLTVYYASSGGLRPYDASFGTRKVVWDVDLLGGYRHEFLRRADTNEVADGFLALRDTDIVPRILRGGHDVLWVHGFSYLTIWLAMLAARGRHMPVLLREEMTLLPKHRPLPKRLVRWAILRGLFSCVHGLYIGSNNRGYFRRYGVPDRKLFFAPYCVDNEDLRQQARELRATDDPRGSFGIEAGCPVVLFVGKLIDRKRPLLVLDAFARVRSRHECALLLVGEGPLESELRRRVKEARIPDVHFAGFLNRSEVPRAFAAADVFVLPSVEETWGIVVNEAMNFGLPLVVSDLVGCAPDLVREGENGLVVAHDDVAAVADALERLVSNRDVRERFGARSLEIVSEWTYDVAAEGIVQACQATLAGRRNRR